MTDDRVLDYLRARGQAEVPPDLVASVMTALDEPVADRSRFAAFLPALVTAGAVAVIALVAFLAGPGRDLGPSPTSTPTSGPSTEATIEDLGVALLDAVEVLRDAPGVEGRQQVEIDGVIGAVTWFDWRPNGDQVLVQRRDLDVTETGWWMAPDGAPPTTGERIHTDIRAAIGDEVFVTGEAGGWEVIPRDDGFPTGGFGPAILDGSILPWRPLDGLVASLEDPSDARVQRGNLPDGGVEWELEFDWMGAPLSQRWTIGPDGELRSWTFEREDRSFDPDGDFNANATRGWLEYTVTDDAPIEPPDVDAAPDAAAVGAPPDLPLQPPPVSLDGVEEVETCAHPSGVYRVTLPDGWWTNRAGGRDALWEACELFGPEPFVVRPAADSTWPAGVAVSISWIDGGCIGSFLELLSSEETTVDGQVASVREYASGTSTDDPPGLYQYVIDLSEPGVDCEAGGRFIMATTTIGMTGDYDENKAFLDEIMATMEVTPP